MPDPTTPADSGMDMSAAVADIGADLFGSDREDTSIDVDLNDAPDDTPSAPEPEAVQTEVTEPKKDEVAAAKAPPKSWSKDKHGLWATLTPEAQDYYEQREKQFLDGLEQYKQDAGYARQLKDILGPYRPFLQAQGIEETQAVQYLMNAHYRLTQGTEAERRAAYEQIGADLGFIQQQAGQQVDPHVQQLQQKVNQLESTLTARQQAELQAARHDAVSKVEVFASDPANVHFNDVAHDMAAIVKSNPDITLKDAYEKAVWANPVTRAKELARIQTEAEANRKAAAEKREEVTQKATAPNVREAAARKAPTEPKGKFLDDSSMLADLRAIKTRS